MDAERYGSIGKNFATSPDAPSEETAFGATKVALERANLLSHRVQQLADRLLGAVPVPVSGAANATAASAVFPALRASAYETQEMVNDALNALDRIERSLP